MATLRQVIDEYVARIDVEDRASRPAEAIATTIDKVSDAATKAAANARQLGETMRETGESAARADPAFERIAGRVDKVTQAQRGLQRASEALQAAQAAAAREGAADDAARERQARTLAELARRVEQWAQRLGEARADAEALEAANAALNGTLQAGHQAFAQYVADQVSSAQASRAAQEASLAAQQAERERTAQVQRLTGALDGYVRALDPVAASLARVQRAEAELAQLQGFGLASAEQTAAVGRMRQEYIALAEASTEAARAQRAAAQADEERAAKVHALSARLDGYVQALDPVAASLAKVQRAEAELGQLQDLGLASPQQIAAVQRMRQEHADLASGVDRTTNSLGLQRYQVQNLTAQFVDFGVQVSSGGGILLPLLQQGPQAVEAVGGVRQALSLVATVLTPVRLAMAAGAVAVGAATVATNSHEAALASLRGQLRGITTDYASMADEVERSARRVAESGLGISRADARTAGVQLRQAAAGARIEGLDFEQLTKLSADAAVVLSTDFAGGLQVVSRALKEPAALVDELAQRGILGMTESLRANAQSLTLVGEKGEAVRRVLAAMGVQMGGASKDVSPLTQGMRDLKSAWDGFTDVVQPWLTGTGTTLLTWLTGLANAASTTAAAFQALATLKLPRIDPNGDGNTSAVTSGSAYQGSESFNAALARQESSGNPGIANRLGYLGLYQYGSDRLQDLGVYQPRPGEGANSWGGTFRIPGFEGVTTRDQFLANAQAQEAVRAIDTARLMPIIEKVMRDNPDMVIQGIGLNAPGLLAVAHLASSSIPEFVRTKGAYNPRDANGTSLLDYYTAFSRTADGKPITVQATQVEISATGTVTSAAAPGAAPASATSSSELDKALRLARGATEPYSRESTRENQLAGVVRALGQIEAARPLAQTAADVDLLEAGARRMRAELESLKGPHAEFVEQQQRAIAAATTLDPVQRAVNEAVTAYQEAMQRVGETPSDAQLAEVRTNKLRELQGAYTGATAEIDRQTASQERISAAYAQGEQAVARAMAAERAHELVRTSGIQGADARKVAEEGVTEALLRRQRVDNDIAALAANQQSQRNLDYLQAEQRLIGANADERERELAALKARMDLQARPGGVSDSVVAEAEKLARQTADANQRTTQLRNSWSAVTGFVEQTTDSIRDGMVQALATGEARTIRWGNIFRAAAAAGVAELAKLALINPALNLVFGGARGTLAGLLSVAGGSAAVSGVDYASLTQTGGGLLAKAGLTYLSAPIASFDAWAAGAMPGTFSAYNGAGAAAAQGQLGNLGADPNVISGLSGAETPFFGTASGTILGTAGILAGGYGIYSGLQRGGAGGYTQAAAGGAGILAGAGTLASAGGSLGAMLGGSAGFLAAAGPYAAAAAAVLAIASAFLPGQKPSDQTGTYRMTLDTGFEAEGGLTGKRYSQENRDAARTIAQSIADIGATLREATGATSTPYAFEVAVGNRDGISLLGNGVTRDYARDEVGQQALIRDAVGDMLESMRGAFSTEVAAVVDASGNDLPKLLGNLDWLRNTYQPLQSGEQANPFRDQVAALEAQWQVQIDKARELTLAEDALVAARDKAIDTLMRQRDLAVANDNLSLDERYLRATGGDLQDVMLRQFDLRAQVEREERRAWLQSLGILSEHATQQMELLERTLTAEREALVRSRQPDLSAYAGQAQGMVASLADYARSLNYAPGTDLSPRQQYEQARRDFAGLEAAISAGDLSQIGRVQDISETYRTAAIAVSGNGTEAMQALDRIRALLSRVSGISADVLTQAVYQAEMRTQTQQLQAALDDLKRAVVSELRAGRAPANTPARAA